MTRHGHHWLALTRGRSINLATATMIVLTPDAERTMVRVWWPDGEGPDTIQGEDADRILRRIAALAAIATAHTEDDLATIPYPPGEERPRP